MIKIDFTPIMENLTGDFFVEILVIGIIFYTFIFVVMSSIQLIWEGIKIIFKLGKYKGLGKNHPCNDYYCSLGCNECDS